MRILILFFYFEGIFGMNKTKLIKSVTSLLLVILILWVATPKVYTQQLFDRNIPPIQIVKESQLKSQSTNENSDLEEYNKPAYFNIFKFIFSFVPSKSKGGE